MRKNKKKKYADYGEYLEDASEEQARQSESYGLPSNRVTITEHKGTLEASWKKKV